MVFACPEAHLDPHEADALKTFLSEGGCVFMMGGEGGERYSNACVNSFTKQFGIEVNDDSVIRSVYHKEYFHPKEALGAPRPQ